MATTIVRTVKAAGQGGDYTSLSAWEAGEQAVRSNLVARDEVAAAECYGFEDPNLAVLSGWTTDQTRNLLVYPHESARHSGVFTTSGYRLTGGQAGDIRLNAGVPYTTIYGIQVAYGHISASSGSVTFDSCLAHLGAIDTPVNAQSGVVFRNCIAYTDDASSILAPFSVGSDVPSNRVTIVGCTGVCMALDPLARAFNAIGYVAYLNCVGYAVPECDYAYALPFASGGYCASTHGENFNFFGMSGSRRYQTFTFMDQDNYDFRLSSTDLGARGYGYPGTNVTTGTVDIVGHLRRAPYDMGAYQTSIPSHRPMPSLRLP